MNKPSLLTSVLAVILFVVTGMAHSANYQEGVDYELIAKPGRVDVPGKIEVREFFWFGCPGCFQLEGVISGWKANLEDDVNFVMTPAALRKSWVNHAHAFYMAQALGKLEEISGDLFRKIHVEKKKVHTKKQLAEFFSDYGLDKAKFEKFFNSNSIKEIKVENARALASQYGIPGVPALIVNGKYLVKSKAGTGYAEQLKVVDYLVEKERIAMQPAAR